MREKLVLMEIWVEYEFAAFIVPHYFQVNG
jgi:hypothetical protein